MRRQQPRPEPVSVDGIARALRSALSDLSVRHVVEYAPRPRPTLVYAEVLNQHGQIWRGAPFHLGREQRDVVLPDFPISWITGRSEDAILGQTSIRLRLEY